MVGNIRWVPTRMLSGLAARSDLLHLGAEVPPPTAMDAGAHSLPGRQDHLVLPGAQSRWLPTPGTHPGRPLRPIPAQQGLPRESGAANCWRASSLCPDPCRRRVESRKVIVEGVLA